MKDAPFDGVCSDAHPIDWRCILDVPVLGGRKKHGNQHPPNVIWCSFVLFATRGQSPPAIPPAVLKCFSMRTPVALSSSSPTCHPTKMTAQGREPQLSPCGNWKVKDEPFYFWADRPIEPPIKVKFYPVVQAMSVLPDFRNYYGQLELSSYHAQLRVVVDGEEICGHRNLINGGPEKAPAYQIDDALYFKFCSLEEGWQRFNESAVGDQLQLCITIYFLGKPIAQCFTRKAQVYKPCEETPDEQQHRDNLELQSLKAEMREVDIRAVTPWSLQTFFSGPGPAISTTPLPKGLSFLRQEEAEYIRE